MRFADEAYPCGPPPSRESYLVMDRVIEIAKRSGAEAIHPGYGFLAENGAFSDRCRDEGIVFIGPSGDVMRAMGDKVHRAPDHAEGRRADRARHHRAALRRRDRALDRARPAPPS